MSVAGLCGLELALLEKPRLRALERECQLLTAFWVGNFPMLQSPVAVWRGFYHSHANLLPVIAAFG